MKGLTRFIQMEVCLSKLSIENCLNYLEIECIDVSSNSHNWIYVYLTMILLPTYLPTNLPTNYITYL